jgi:hypothetical protein
MKERPTPPDIIHAPPPYERISRGLTRLLEERGRPVRDGFPPGKALIDYGHATGELTLHPWLPLRLRAEFLLDAAVSRLEAIEYERRLEVSEDDEVELGWYQGDDEPWRAPIVKLVAGRALGLTEDATDETDEDQLSPGEQSAVALIVGAVGDNPRYDE